MSFKVIAFDVGGTLMEYVNMPLCWLDHYENALDEAVKNLSIGLSAEQKSRTLEILRSFNPKMNYREIDYPPEHIFKEACEDWDFPFVLKSVIDEFFKAFHLKAYVYPESQRVLKDLKNAGYHIAVLTDVAAAMPDELHKSFFSELIPYFDIYVSSVSCGWRKPNTRGLEIISNYFGMTADEMIYVGDEQKDIECAKRFGCKSVLIDRKVGNADYGQDFKISELEKLKQIL